MATRYDLKAIVPKGEISMATLRKEMRKCFEPERDMVSVQNGEALVELRIGKSKQRGTRYVELTPSEAQVIGCALLACAENIKPGKRLIVPEWGA